VTGKFVVLLYTLFFAASENGGAISSQQFARIAVRASTFSSNRAMDGAAIGLKDNASAVLEAGVQLLGNVAEKTGGGLAAEGNTQVSRRMRVQRVSAVSS
jgi:hypothetical protein